VAALGCTRESSNGQTSSDEAKPDLAQRHETGLIQLSRQQQLEEKINAALQLLNEHDEEGRSLPEEGLGADDVGRTVLRRASTDDMCWVEKFFGSSSSHSIFKSRGPVNVLGYDKGSSSTALRLWSSSTIILLLCRAIAPHEDPPLGCAVLTLGFSMQKGKMLRLAQIASEPHLPKERFIECLLSFADCMGCSLETSLALEPSFTSLQKGCLGQILGSHLRSLKETTGEKEFSANSALNPSNKKMPRPLEETIVQPSLQSVKEEDDCVEDSDSSQQNMKIPKGLDKPTRSKRSRFE